VVTLGPTAQATLADMKKQINIILDVHWIENNATTHIARQEI
jgi:hypothetical protein